MGDLLKIECVDSRLSVHILASTNVPFPLTTMQVPNLALTHTKRNTGQWGLVSGLLVRNVAKPNEVGGDIPPMNGILNQLSKGLTLCLSFSVHGVLLYKFLTL
jgi:hypothetical protein